MEKNTTLCGTKCDLLVAYFNIPLFFYIHHFLSWPCVCRTHKYVGTCTHIGVNVNEWGSMVLILGVSVFFHCSLHHLDGNINELRMFWEWHSDSNQPALGGGISIVFLLWPTHFAAEILTTAPFPKPDFTFNSPKLPWYHATQTKVLFSYIEPSLVFCWV